MQFFALTVVALAVLSVPVSVGAETFRLNTPDGTVHWTNAPTDPRYVRMGIAPARAAAASLSIIPAAARFASPSVIPAAAASIASHIKDAAARHGISERLVSAVIRVESGFNPHAVSPKGARGLMQLMPTTASILGVRNAFDPGENIEGGVRHLRGLIDRFDRDLRLALAAYNAGEQAVQQYRGIPPYRETQDYVARVLQLAGDDAAPSAAPAVVPLGRPTYRLVGDDGTTTYTNIPPRPRR